MRWAIGLGALLMLALTTAPASASFKRGGNNAPWCLAYSDLSGIVDCGFYSYEQCMETLWGVGGSCTPNYNTRYVEQPPRRKLKRR